MQPFAGIFAITLATAGSAFAHGETGSGNSIGAPGDVASADRRIEVIMTDNAFDPKVIIVSLGETVHFTVKNEGELVHEFNIGTATMHANHRDEMMMMMDNGVLEADRINHNMMGMSGVMKHDDPNSVLLEPGETAEIVWTFGGSEGLEFGCNVPGHYESGMVGAFEMS